MENKQEPVTQTEEKTEDNTVTQTEKKTEEKTYTQEDYNAFEKKLKAKYEKKYEGIDIAKYKKWEESQKTETEKQTELTQNLANTTNERDSLKQENQVLKSGVNIDDVDYVLFKVSKMEGDFEENLESFLKENPKYLQKEETIEAPKTTGVAVQKIKENADSGVLTILRAKHPELFKEGE